MKNDLPKVTLPERDFYPITSTSYHPSKDMLPVISVTVVLLLVLGGVYLYFQNWQLQKEIAQLRNSNSAKSIVSPLVSPSPSPLTNITLLQTKADWQMYSPIDNEPIFKYPADWIVVASDEEVHDGKQQRLHIVNIVPQYKVTDNNKFPVIQLYYYSNREKLTIQEFNNKYLNKTSAGDPISIWDEHYKSVTNSNGINAYYDDQHYCVSQCQIYVWSSKDKIYILKYLPDGLTNQEEIFNGIFESIVTP